MADQQTRRLDQPLPEESCLKCGGRMKEAELRNGGPWLVAKDGPQRLWDASALAAKVCNQCGYTEFYAQKPEKF